MTGQKFDRLISDYFFLLLLKVRKTFYSDADF